MSGFPPPPDQPIAPSDEQKPPRSRSSEFWAGAFAWALFNIGLGLVLAFVQSRSVDAPVGAISLLANVVWLLYFGVKRPWFALGALGCIGLVLAAVLVLGIVLAVICSTAYR